MPNVIQTKKLTKYYGKQRGVVDLDLEIREGEIFGFLGSNGAGKTTTMRLLLHLLKPTSGTADILGHSIKGDYMAYLSQIGYLPGDIRLYDNMTGKQLLDFTNNFYQNLNSSSYQVEIVKRLECQMDKPFSKLSKGNRQKIGILLALFHKPRLLFLDEPTSGLDPITQNAFYEILKELKSEGVTIIFSSHNLQEVEKVCDRVGIIREGRLVQVETLDDLRRRFVKRVEIVFGQPYDLDVFQKLPGVKVRHSSKSTLGLDVPTKSIGTVLPAIARYNVKDVNFYSPSLEELFLTYYQ